jgi:hypothetical protein
MSTIKQGYGTTILDGDQYTLTVAFTTAMPSALYTASCYAQQDAGQDVVLPQFTDQTINGFKIHTPIACDVFWTAIYVAP